MASCLALVFCHLRQQPFGEIALGTRRSLTGNELKGHTIAHYVANSRLLSPIVTLPAGGALLFLRWIVECYFPILPKDFKGLIYMRDIAILSPAACVICVAMVRMRHQKWILPLATIVERCAAFSRNKRKWTVFLLCASMFLACSVTSVVVLKTRAHTIDETLYLFQAKLFSAGNIWASPAQSDADFFELQYLIQTPEKWYGAFFPGQGLVLALGECIGLPYLVNPFLCAILLAVTVWAGSKLFTLETGLLAALLMLISPFVLFQGSSYFSHIATALLVTLGMVLLVTHDTAPAGKPLALGLLIGLIACFRPLSALLLGLFAVIWRSANLRGKPDDTPGLSASGQMVKGVKTLLQFTTLLALGALPGTLLLAAYSACLTGHPLVTPHHVAFPYERLFFGIHSIKNSLINLTGLSVDLMGVPLLSLVPLCAYFLTRDKWSKTVLGFSVLYCVGYSIYPYHGLSYGPRFYFELVPLLLLASCRGLSVLSRGMERLWPGTTGKAVGWRTSFLAAAVVVSLLGVLPGRIAVFGPRGQYYTIAQTIVRSVTTPAVVAISPSDERRIYPYIAGFQLNTTSFDGPVIYVNDLPERRAELASEYPDRHCYRFDVGTRTLTAYPPGGAKWESGKPAEWARRFL